MLATLMIALIAFLNSVVSYHLSNVSFKKISYISSFVLLFIAIGLGIQEYLRDNNKPRLDLYSFKLPKGKNSNQYLFWLQLQNHGSSALQDVSASLIDMVSSLEKFENNKDTTINRTKASNNAITPEKISIGTIPGNNGTELYRAVIDGNKIQGHGFFQIELNWNNNGILYSFQIVEKKGALELINPQVREKNQGTLDAKDFYHFYSTQHLNGESVIKEQKIKFK